LEDGNFMGNIAGNIYVIYIGNAFVGNAIGNVIGNFPENTDWNVCLGPFKYDNAAKTSTLSWYV
jgi:hypothetical protein